MSRETVLNLAKRIKAIADTGVLYTTTNFDRERWHELRSIAEDLMANELNISSSTIQLIFDKCIDYPTPKVDIRALVLNSKKEILMVQEMADNCWSLPGGWADIGKTPSEIALQEVWEETGLEITCKYLSAVFDKKMHDHPPQPFYVYKMVFYCEPVNDTMILKPAFDVLNVAWFRINKLPQLSKDRILASQIQLIYKNISEENYITIFD
jgi:ADP-ribose pyrophosphatase YjhB (NUDIX family)